MTVSVHSDFGSQENKVCHCFHIFPILPWGHPSNLSSSLSSAYSSEVNSDSFDIALSMSLDSPEPELCKPGVMLVCSDHPL